MLIVDDVLATGGTARAAASLVEQVGGKVCGIATVIELDFLHGRERLVEHELYTLIAVLSGRAVSTPYTCGTRRMRWTAGKTSGRTGERRTARRTPAFLGHACAARHGRAVADRPAPEEGPRLQPEGRRPGDRARLRLRRGLARGAEAEIGEDFITHPLAVTEILADLRLDTTTLEAALLHDTVEDTEVSLADIEEEFGPEVARIVDGLTKLDRLEFRTRGAGAGGERPQDDRRDGR